MEKLSPNKLIATTGLALVVASNTVQMVPEIVNETTENNQIISQAETPIIIPWKNSSNHSPLPNNANDLGGTVRSSGATLSTPSPSASEVQELTSNAYFVPDGLQDPFYTNELLANATNLENAQETQED